LTDAAEGARDYADPGAALAAARRLQARRRVIATSIVAAVATMAALGVGAAPDRESGPQPSADGYPSVVTRPAQAEPLPERPVGPASLIYAPCIWQCDPYLVLPDGTQYALPETGVGGEPTAGYSLSPDGRWLGHPTRTGFRLRDLTTTTSRDIHDDGPGVTEAWAWSPNGGRLLLVRHADGVVHHFRVVDVTTGSAQRHAAAGRQPIAVRDDGSVVYWTKVGPTGGTVGIANLTTDVVATVELDLRAVVRQDEAPVPQTLRLGPDGYLAVLTVTLSTPLDDLGQPSALILVDLGSGSVRRLDLPLAGTAVLDPRALRSDGVLLVRTTPEQTEVVRLDEVTGRWTVLSRLPRDSQVVLPGTSR
jgi:hypothetical protein